MFPRGKPIKQPVSSEVILAKFVLSAACIVSSLGYSMSDPEEAEVIEISSIGCVIGAGIYRI